MQNLRQIIWLFEEEKNTLFFFYIFLEKLKRKNSLKQAAAALSIDKHKQALKQLDAFI